MYTHFHSDGSNVDWGWKMTARATTQAVVEGTELHYLRDTADALTALIGGTVKALLRGYDREREKEREREREKETAKNDLRC